ncbi:BatD family protein [Ruegeria arenilitoris]|uniref:BatD family protein n=1 Tax=Ruegeria arenilitoris TaxID=1173585 RepID=UPI00147D2794|nr:BatD family protein [Ruegeria arenilitoris]
MKWLVLMCLFVPVHAVAQSKTVLPSELSIEVTVEENVAIPFTREMILISIRGVYRRHITREKLVQPDFNGFSWAQLGPDHWTEERINGRNFKVFTRRMAVYPVRSGTLTIGRFTHSLTLTDENDDWFQHDIQSEPLTIEVATAPASAGWWFPVRDLKISDQWSNAPDQLSPGEGVLRVIRIEALGATPEMVPPMPELHSPSAMIFAHPEKRLVELTPDGPVTYAFWRWTIRPGNDTSGIVEPLQFSYFDTVARENRDVTISAQRVAYGTVAGGETGVELNSEPTAARLPGWPAVALAAFVFAIGVVWGMSGRKLTGLPALQRFGIFDPLVRDLRTCARTGRADGLRRAAAAILRRDGLSQARLEQMREFDRRFYDPKAPAPDLMGFARDFLRN